MEPLTCNCGNDFMLSTQQFQKAAPEVLVFPEGTEALMLPLWCPGCGSIWVWGRNTTGQPAWERKIAHQNLKALRDLSAQYRTVLAHR